jgi:hypothetical protein
VNASPPASSADSKRDAVFQSTLWSRVRAAGRLDALGSRQALEALCCVYWPAIYAFLRRSGCEREQAKDLTQGFFVHLLETNLLQKADPERGRFRSFLLGSLRFFVSNEQAKARALKRGGEVRWVSIEPGTGEGCAALDLASHLTPERLFDRKWAMSVLGEAMARLTAEYRRAGLAEEFALLQPHLTGDAEECLSGLAVRLGKTAGATRVLVFRLRNRFRRLIRAVIADTVSDLDQVESELQHLEEALRDD